MKYIVCVDWKAGYSSGFDYYPLKSDNILDAMEEAEQYINENVYLITVMEKQKGVKRVKGCPDVKEMTYTDVITNRGNGWHRTNDKHSEVPFTTQILVNRDGKIL